MQCFVETIILFENANTKYVNKYDALAHDIDLEER